MGGGIARAASAIGFFPLLLMGLGGLSVLDLLEKAVLFRELDVIAPIRAMLEGYQRVTGWAAAFIEPPLRPMIAWLNETFDWRLTLQPNWRSLFVVSLIVATSLARFLDFEGVSKSERTLVVAVPISVALGALLGALGAGVMAAETSWWGQGLAAGLPTAFMLLTFGLVASVAEAWWSPILWPLLAGAVAFSAGAAVSFLPGAQRSAGVIVLAAIIAVLGTAALILAKVSGDDNQSAPSMARLGFNLIGGFIAAGVTLLADWAIKSLS